MAGGFIPDNLAPRYRDVAMRIADAVAKPLAAAPAQRIHGDLHRSNVLGTSDGPVLVDFDDFVTGPPAQDLWLLAPGDSEEARRARWEIVEGYEVFRELDRSTLALCEPLRAIELAEDFVPLDDLPDRKSTRLNSSHVRISYAVVCLEKKNRI